MIFREAQKFTQWWVWLILLLPVIFLLSVEDSNYNFGTLILIVIIILFYLIELRVSVNSQGIHYQFFPFHLKSYIIKNNEIKKIEALKYRPLSDYGGWGIRYAFKCKCYNVKGNLGVKVFLKNGSYVLFGSQKNKELARALKQIIQQ